MNESTNPATEVQSPEDRLASLFAAEEPTDEEADEAKPEAEDQEAEQEPEADEAEEEATEEAEVEEVEFQGKTYKVPPEIKTALMKDADYTKKTQEVAEQRKVIEERTKFLDRIEELRSANFERAVSLSNLESQIKQFDAVNWDELARSDQSEFLRLDRAYRSLREQRDGIKEELRQAATGESQAVDEFRQEMLRRGAEELKRDIKGWSPDLAKALSENAKNYGFTEAELGSIADARFVKALHDAYQWRKLQASKPELTKKVANARPVKSASRSAPQAQRDSQVASQRQALRKSGSTDAAEAFFESLFKRK